MTGTTFEQTFADLASCINANAADPLRRRAIERLLVLIGYADRTIESQPDEIVLNLARQAIVGACGPDAWSGE